ncbi:carbohydrate kinase [Reinekea thalattae]|uniref:Winged helix-turn-helix transcriptional regulator n=1 Tax=Reinekea thalattae TaxID=2593301 RepID=A0A5C8Z482_9GAMM|nr:carbohydrate kinase [Reinekea thalattae]TXR52114.1 winged helix-turn-helix transcriptional regulator [Reinekea thalattae]
MNDLERKILTAIKQQPMATQQELAAALQLSRESVAGYISRLTQKGAILGKGYILPNANNIVVLGGANVDLTGTSTANFRMGDSNPGVVNQSAGGVGRNIAENLARLGNDVSMLSLVGHDHRGRFLIEHAREVGISTDDIIQHPDFATSSYLAMNNEQGELVGAIADMAIIDQLTPALLADKLPRLQAATTLVVEANLLPETLSWLAQQKLSAPIIADAVSAAKAPRLIPLLAKIDVLKVNRFEALAILKKPETDSSSVEQLIDELLAQGVGSVLLSLAEQGVMYGDAEHKYLQSVPACQIASDTGAGDALIAGYVHSLKLTEQIKPRLGFAIACAVATLESKDAVSTLLTETYVCQRFADFLTTTEFPLTELESHSNE